MTILRSLYGIFLKDQLCDCSVRNRPIVPVRQVDRDLDAGLDARYRYPVSGRVVDVDACVYLTVQGRESFESYPLARS